MAKGSKGMSVGTKQFLRMCGAVFLVGVVLIVLQVTVAKKPLQQLSDKFPA